MLGKAQLPKLSLDRECGQGILSSQDAIDVVYCLLSMPRLGHLASSNLATIQLVYKGIHLQSGKVHPLDSQVDLPILSQAKLYPNPKEDLPLHNPLQSISALVAIHIQRTSLMGFGKLEPLGPSCYAVFLITLFFTTLLPI